MAGNAQIQTLERNKSKLDLTQIKHYLIVNRAAFALKSQQFSF